MLFLLPHVKKLTPLVKLLHLAFTFLLKEFCILAALDNAYFKPLHLSDQPCIALQKADLFLPHFSNVMRSTPD
jgi:hypothetical protein